MTDIIIKSDYSMGVLEEIDRGLRFLLETKEGTYPLDRNFGINKSYVDMLPDQAANALAIELQEKIPVYEPRVQLKQVKMLFDKDGGMYPSIEVEGAEE